MCELFHFFSVFFFEISFPFPSLSLLHSPSLPFPFAFSFFFPFPSLSLFSFAFPISCSYSFSFPFSFQFSFSSSFPFPFVPPSNNGFASPGKLQIQRHTMRNHEKTVFPGKPQSRMSKGEWFRFPRKVRLLHFSPKRTFSFTFIPVTSFLFLSRFAFCTILISFCNGHFFLIFFSLAYGGLGGAACQCGYGKGFLASIINFRLSTFSWNKNNC